MPRMSSRGMSLACQERVAARHIIDVSSKQLVTAVALHHHAWLRLASIMEDVRNRIEGLPFDRVGLFDPKTDEILESLLKHRRTARSISAQGASRGSWR